MPDNRDWKTDKEAYENAWTKYQQVADRVYAAYEEVHGGAQDQTPANEDLAELQQAWQELENARERLGQRQNQFHERMMDSGKSMSS